LSLFVLLGAFIGLLIMFLFFQPAPRVMATYERPITRDTAATTSE